MKRYITSLLSLLIVMTLTANGAWAEVVSPDKQPCSSNCTGGRPKRGERPPFDKEKFNREIQDYIISKAGLLPREAEAFFPIYFEMKEKTRNQQRKIENAYRRADRQNMGNTDCERVLNEAEKMEQKLNRIRSQYMKRLRKALSAQKLVKALNADQNFGRDQFRKMFHAAKPEQEGKR